MAEVDHLKAFWEGLRDNPEFARQMVAIAEGRATNPQQGQISNVPPPDSTYLAFLRGVGFEEADARAVHDANIAAIRNSYTLQRDNLARSGEDARKQIGDSHLTRGTNLSGQKLEDLARQRSLEQRSLAELSQEESNRISGASTELTSKMAGFARQRAEAESGLIQRSEQRKAEERILAAQLGQAGAGGGGSAGFSMPSFSMPAPAQPAMSVEEQNRARVAAMSPQEQEAFGRWVTGLQAGANRTPANPYNSSYGRPRGH